MLSGVSPASSAGECSTNSAEDMAALPFAFLDREGCSWGSTLVRLARPPRAGAASGDSGECSGLVPRWAVFLLRVEAGGGREGAGGGG